jgi:hypothetical protein
MSPQAPHLVPPHERLMRTPLQLHEVMGSVSAIWGAGIGLGQEDLKRRRGWQTGIKRTKDYLRYPAGG